ncbi:MAG: hypothetical protein LC624_08670 [Halobacteriales archaeon]|nr:hypothetical protein [Halobacteriales archaeon]
MLRTALVLLVALLAIPLPVQAAAQAQSSTKCLADVDAVLCVTAAMSLDIQCHRIDPGHVSCDAPFTWTVSGHSTAFVPGAAQHAASAFIQFTPPGFGYGVGFRIDACSWTVPANSCTSTDTFNLNPGPWPLAVGDCVGIELSGFAEADGFLVGYTGHSLITATVSDSMSTTFCG